MPRHVILEVDVESTSKSQTGSSLETATVTVATVSVILSRSVRPVEVEMTADPIAEEDMEKFLDNPERFGKKVFLHAVVDESSATTTKVHVKSIILAEAFANLQVLEVDDPKRLSDATPAWFLGSPPVRQPQPRKKPRKSGKLR